MKKQFKTKLQLNSQCIRVLRGTLDAVHGGRPMLDDSVNRCVSDVCTDACTVACTGGCRVCG